VLSQFTDDLDRSTLANFIDVPNVYPAGRLDFDSEGLMLLTDNGKLQAQISHPKYKLAKTYWVQVEGETTQNHLRQLCKGIVLKDGKASAISAQCIDAPRIPERNPPIRIRKNVPDSWLELVIDEGRNRQVRRMTAAVGLPTLRLVRCAIGDWSLDGLGSGDYRLTRVDIAALAR
tara:strand:+ start:368 stop:892 length:525 start_codon:yes stop_codon:yes gene_type:complete